MIVNRRRSWPYADPVQLPVPARRLAYRCAYRSLQLLWFVRRPQKRGVKCVLTDADRILLVRHTYGRRWWDLPGGAVKRGEPPLSAARREMREELGIQAADWYSAGELRGSQDFRHDTIYCFRAELSAPAVDPDEGELAAARWFARSELPSELGPYVLPIVTGALGD